jgi:Superinfection immunity protein
MISMDLLALLATVALILVVLGMYWLPSIVGYYRRVPDLVSVVVTNALLGWTGVGWLVSLLMALRVADRPLSAPPPG